MPKCNECDDTGLMTPPGNWYNCELGGTCDKTKEDCKLCGKTPCPCGAKSSLLTKWLEKWKKEIGKDYVFD